MGLADRIYEDAIEVYFTCRQMNGISSGQTRLLPLSSPGISASSPERPSVWRFGGSVDQCVEVKMPMLLGCTGKPSSADVASVVYAGQRHPRTARFQPNNIAGFERLCHSPILQLLRPVPLSTDPETGATSVMKPCPWFCDDNALYNGSGRETLRYGRTHMSEFHHTCCRQKCGCPGACRCNGVQ